MATTVGTIQLLATIDTSRYKQGQKEIENSNESIEKSAGRTEKNSNKAFNSIAKVGLGAIIGAAVAVGVAITKNIGNAIDRIDTLVAFPRVLQALGSTSDEAQAATDKLSESLRGLPTSLQSGASGVQQLVTAGLDVPKATDAFLALNNALLVAGGGTAQAESAMMQLQQALSRGRIEGQEWNTIAANMPTVLQALANETGKSKDELREMFRENPQALIDNIIRLNKEGGGGLASLDKQARDATGGIGTAMDNLNNAITRGIEGIVKSLGDGDLQAGQERISNAITKLGEAFGRGLEIAGAFFKFLVDNKDVITPIAIALGTMIGLVTTWYSVLKVATAVQRIFNATLAANPIGAVIIVIAGLVAAFIWLWNNVEGFRNFFIEAWEKIKTAWSVAGEFFKGIWNGIKNAFGNVASWFSDTFRKAWEGVKNVFSAGGRIFSGIKDGILSVFKTVVNGIIGGLNTIIKVPFDGINAALRRIRDISIAGAKPFGWINEINVPQIPKLAEGGIISSPTLAMIGEGGESEAVIPLSKLDRMLENERSTNNDNSSITINLQGVFATSPAEQRRVAEQIAQRLKEIQASRGLAGGIA